MNLPVLGELFLHCLTLSLLAIGGAVATAPDLHRYVVNQQGWLSDGDFTASMALAQAAPGPNLLFIAVVGYNVAGLAGASAAMLGILLPSTLLTLFVARWGRRRSESLGVRSFVAGMAPLTLGLVAATGVLLAVPVAGSTAGVALVLATVAISASNRLSPMALMAVGAVLGALGWV